MTKDTQIKIAIVAFAVMIVTSGMIVWRDRQGEPKEKGIVVFETDAAKVTSLTVERDGETRVLTPEDEDAKAVIEAVSRIVSEARYRKVKDLSQYGLQPPVFTVIISSDNKEADGKALHFGDYNRTAKRYFLQFDDEDYVYLISTELVALFD